MFKSQETKLSYWIDDNRKKANSCDPRDKPTKKVILSQSLFLPLFESTQLPSFELMLLFWELKPLMSLLSEYIFIYFHFSASIYFLNLESIGYPMVKFRPDHSG